MCDVHLPLRAALLAIVHGCLAFAVIPSLILHATGCAWGLDGVASWHIAVEALLCLPLMVLGLSAVQMFPIHSRGTAIPLNPTRRLVGVGVFAQQIDVGAGNEPTMVYVAGYNERAASSEKGQDPGE